MLANSSAQIHLYFGIYIETSTVPPALFSSINFFNPHPHLSLSLRSLHLPNCTRGTTYPKFLSSPLGWAVAVKHVLQGIRAEPTEQVPVSVTEDPLCSIVCLTDLLLRAVDRFHSDLSGKGSHVPEMGVGFQISLLRHLSAMRAAHGSLGCIPAEAQAGTAKAVPTI